jgi:hypothetical protein
MKITTVTVGLRKTESLPEYRNVAPSLTLTAEVEPGDDWPQVEQRLKSDVEAHIEAWIDDELEKAGQPAKFSLEPRYDLWHWTSAGMLIILPAGEATDYLPGHWWIYSDDDFVGRGHRLLALKRATIESGLEKFGEYSSAITLHAMVWQYLTRADVWSIVGIDALSPDPNEKTGWHALGHIAIDGDTMIDLMANDFLCWELMGGRSVGTRAEIVAIIAKARYDNTAIAETTTELNEWVEERLQTLRDDLKERREAQAAGDSLFDNDDDEEEEDRA